ncbi:MAG: HEAT repeat domain-containing protein, partial [Myxococcales bacterium]|nr:HEAT repeat domain-containing protein [Myxococcales bacterium]
MVHCDLKPENVFVLKQGAQGSNQDFVKIVDFGIATSLNQDQGPLLPDLEGAAGSAKSGATLVDPQDANRTVTGGIVGTPPYMAPEQVRGQALDFRVDQYALGCILYQLLCGKTPFDGPNMNAILMGHIFDPVPALSTHGVTVSPTLEAIVKRLLEKDVAARYGAMLDVEAVLASEIELLQLRRGEKTAVPRALASTLGVEGKSNALFVFGRQVPLWLFGSLMAVVLLGAGLVAYQTLRPREVRRELQPGELQALRKQALAVLREALKATQPDAPARRVAALAALGQSHDVSLRADLEAELQAAIERKDTDSQSAAAEALGNLGDAAAIPKLAALLDTSQDSSVRASVASSLRQLGDARGLSTLNAMIDSKDSEAQLRAAMLLCEGASGRSQSVLAALSKQEQASSALRISALFCLAQVADPTARSEARHALSTLVRGKGPLAERVTAAARLGDLGDDTGRDFLRMQVKRPGPVADQLLAARLLAGPEEAPAVGLCRRVVREKAGEPSTRQVAAEGLAAGGDLFDARLLGQRLAATEPAPVRESSAAAIVLLAAQDPSTLSEASLTWARSALQDKSALSRLAAAAALGDVQGAGAVQLLAGMLRDHDAAVRRGAARALGRRKENEALSALLSGLDDADPEVRAETIRSLGQIAESGRKRGTHESSAAVMKRLKVLAAQGSQVEQALAASTLLNLGESGQSEKLRGLSRSDDVEVRKLVVEQARGDEGILQQALSDSASIVRFAAARRLAEQGDKRAEPVLREVLDKGGRDSLIAYGLLRKLGIAVDGQKALAESLGATEAPKSAAESEQRLAQIEALGRVPIDVALPVLRQASRDASPEVRRAAIGALAEQYRSGRSPDVLATLRRMLTDSDAGVRARAAAVVASLSREGSMPLDREAPATSPEAASPVRQPSPESVGSAAGKTTDAPIPPVAIDAGSGEPTAAPSGKPSGDADQKGEADPSDEKASSKASQAEQLLRSGLESFSRR